MSTKYFHGVRVQEESTALLGAVTGTAGMQVVIGTAPVNLAEDPEAAVNIPVLCSSMEEAGKKLGYSEDFETYTLCQSMYASFVLFGAAPVVFINVLDPAKHKKDNEEKEYGIVNRQVKVDDLTGIIRNSVVVKKEETVLEKEKDYVLSFDDTGHLIITLISDATAEAEKLKVSSASVDASKVTDADII